MTPWTVTRQASLSTGFPRQEYWSGLLFPFPGDHLDPVIEPMSPALAGRFFTTEPLGKSHFQHYKIQMYKLQGPTSFNKSTFRNATFFLNLSLTLLLYVRNQDGDICNLF